MKAKNWLIGWFVMTVAALAFIGGWVVKVDPFMHYHKPDTDKYYYTLNNERSQNDGIIRHFDYDALITGTSMTENFKTSEFDDIFGVHSIKVSFSGGSYKEMNDNIRHALERNPKCKTVVRALDYDMLVYDKDFMRTDLGVFPTYLYDDNPFNDVQYLYNKDIIFGKVYEMEKARKQEGFVPGITSFDDYAAWQNWYTYGINSILPYGISYQEPGEPVYLADDEREHVIENVQQNVVDLAKEYPDVDFYYFFTPYSAANWSGLVNDGTIYWKLEAEKIAIEMILECDNIHLYSFNNCYDITLDLNNYMDGNHYGGWVNSLILQWMKDGEYQITKDNYEEYQEQELQFYSTFDYTSLNNQTDYDDAEFEEMVGR